MAQRREYAQNCGLALALDVLGERWTLLLVRELFLGPRRFNDLAAALPGIGTNLLADRLKQLTAHGVVAPTVLPAPANVPAYALTPRGRELRPMLNGLALWGFELLGEGAADRHTRAAWIAMSMAATYEQDPDPELRLTAAFAVGDEHLGLVVDGPSAELTLGVPARPELEVSCGPDVLLDLGAHRVGVAEATAQRGLVVTGDPARLERLLARFRLPGTSRTAEGAYSAQAST